MGTFRGYLFKQFQDLEKKSHLLLKGKFGLKNNNG